MSNIRRRSKGSGYLFKKNDIYYIRYNINGKIKEKSLKTKNKKQAEKDLEDFQPLISATTKEELVFHVSQARNLLKKNSIKIKDIWELYQKSPKRPKSQIQTLSKYEFKINSFTNWLEIYYPHITELGQITNDIAREYAKLLWEGRKQGNKMIKISAKTYNDHIAALRLIINTLSDKENFENPFNSNNISKEQTNHQTRKELTKEEVIQIFSFFDKPKNYLLNKEEMKILFYIAAWTALRLKDCALLKWENINLNRNIITLIPSKTRKTQRYVTIPIHPNLYNEFNNAKKWKINEFILPQIADRYNRNPSGIVKDIRKVFVTMGFKTMKEVNNSQRYLKANVYGLHSFRHTFVSFCAEAGVPMAVVEAIVGHGNPSMTKHYTHIGEKSAIQAINALPIAKTNTNTKEKVINLLENASVQQLNRVYDLLNKEIP